MWKDTLRTACSAIASRSGQIRSVLETFAKDFSQNGLKVQINISMDGRSLPATSHKEDDECLPMKDT